MTIEWNEGKAIYLQIMDHIIKEIAAGKLKPGQRMKSVREYAAEFGGTFSGTLKKVNTQYTLAGTVAVTYTGELYGHM